MQAGEKVLYATIDEKSTKELQRESERLFCFDEFRRIVDIAKTVSRHPCFPVILNLTRHYDESRSQMSRL